MIKYSDKYKDYFNENYLMGPNSIRLLDELLIKYPLNLSKDNAVLDLGCGKGLSSLVIAKETGATVYANDLWISKEDNYKRFAKWHMEEQLIPSCEDANDISFDHETFDAIISIDSYHYFAGKENFFKEKILPYLKKGGTVLIGIPGMKEAYEGKQDLLNEWLGKESQLFHSCSWWKNMIGDSEKIAYIDTWELENFTIAWDEWLAMNNKYAQGDKVHYESIIKRYTTFVGIAIKLK